MQVTIGAMKNKENCRYKVSKVFNLKQLRLNVKDREKNSSERIKTKVGRKQVLPC
jgi:phosphotransferase system IIB component